MAVALSWHLGETGQWGIILRGERGWLCPGKTSRAEKFTKLEFGEILDECLGGFPGCIRESGKHLSRGANVGRRANVWDTDRPLLTDNTVSSTSWGKNVQHVYCTVVWNSSNFTAQTVQQLNIVKTPVSHLINSLCHNSHYSYKCK